MKLSFAFLKVWIDPWKEYVIEFVGVLLFVFLASSVVVSQSVFGEVHLLTTAIGMGLSYTCVLYGTNHISGGFLNPAVVISLWLVKRLSGVKTVFYLIAQFLGSVGGAVLVSVAFGQRAVMAAYGVPALGLGVGIESALVLEIILSAVFVFLVFAVCINKTAPGVFGPLVFGLFLTVATIISFPVSGASINVVRSFGPIVLSGEYSNLVAYLAGGLTGSFVGVFYEYAFLRRVKR